MADYRVLVPRFFVDERIYDMLPDEKIVMTYLVLGMQACGLNEVGIYTITRGEIAFGTGIEAKRIGEILNFFNREKKQLIEYDEEHHIVFVKSFLKHNSLYLTTPDKFADAIRKDYKKTFDKCPKFWAEFAKINYNKIIKALEGLGDKSKNHSANKKILQELLDLMDFYENPDKKLAIKIQKEMEETEAKFS